MSYILQALARSERERKQLEAGDLSEVLETSATPTHTGPAYPWLLALAAGALITLALAATFVTLSTGHRTDALPGTPTREPLVAEADLQTASPSQPAHGTDSPAVKPPSAVIAPPKTRLTATAPLRQVAASREPGSTGRPDPLPATGGGQSPIRDDANALREPDRVRSLPGIDITVHVYSDRPERRFVYVNGKRYKEQETIDGMSARVASITREGMIVDFGDRRVLLEVHE